LFSRFRQLRASRCYRYRHTDAVTPRDVVARCYVTLKRRVTYEGYALAAATLPHYWYYDIIVTLLAALT